ncbi:hypothetical protein pqer_cds_841 [Pandoravirus quercus]|uniref:Ankyrin repeat domain containing protein n=2 Tax=Pandoravirus TaxID=2060084 RepID=A0A2U7U9Z4_9VIRU|nr:hypothetical protein pqer_cds_841 [Pandoravirus quercus]AVK75263.1 hypothetical protein pqer_cds_841 [Pandoravirus quercus]QBZ81436.1 hypothetical protein pclt_cds_849 [Pandoravirus celtis]
METLPREVIFHVLCAVADDRDFLACLCAARLFSVYSRAHVLERQCRRCRTAVAAARHLSPDALDYFRRTRKERFDSAAIYAAASVGRVDNVRWLYEHTDAPHRPAIIHRAVACGPRILVAAVRSGSAATVAFLLDQGYRVSRHAFVEAAQLARVDLLRMLDTAAPGNDMFCVASAAIANDCTDAFLFAVERMGMTTRSLAHALFRRAAIDPVGRSRDARFALLLVKHGTLNSEALAVVLQVAEGGTDDTDVRARLERAVTTMCVDRSRDRHIVLGCLPLGIADRVDDPVLLQRGPACSEANALMRRHAKHIVPLDKAIGMARVMWGDAASEELVSTVAQWFAEGGDLAGAAAIGWIFATRRLPRPQCLDGAPVADVLVFALAHCKGHITHDTCIDHIVAYDDVDLLRIFLDSNDKEDVISVVQWHHARYAAHRGSLGILRFLAERGYGLWPCDFVASAVRSRRLDVVQFVCGLGVGGGRVAIINAISLGCDDMVTFLCDHCADACPRMAMRVAIVNSRHDLVRLLCDRKDIGVCRGGAGCCGLSLAPTRRSHEPMDVDALFAHCADACSHQTMLKHAADLKDDNLFNRLVAEHHHDDDTIRHALAGAVDAGSHRAIGRISAHFGHRLASMPWPSHLVDLCRSMPVRIALVDALAQHAPYLCTAKDFVRYACSRAECGIDGRCAAEDQFWLMLWERPSRSSGAIVAT